MECRGFKNDTDDTWSLHGLGAQASRACCFSTVLLDNFSCLVSILAVTPTLLYSMAVDVCITFSRSSVAEGTF